MSKTVFITGASSGFGKLTAKKFQEEGWNVVATMRTPQNETELNTLENVLISELDVTKPDSIAASVSEAIEKFGKIDVLVNNAGYGTAGTVEAATDKQVRAQMEVNFFGLINVTKAVLPHMRKEKSGTVVNISSIGGRITFPYFSLYHATKFAVEGLTESMQFELNPLGIQLKLVEPGAFKTDFATRSLDVFDTSNFPYYTDNQNKFFSQMGQMTENSGDPIEVANTIFKASTDGSEQLRYLVGKDAVEWAGARTQLDEVQYKNMIKENMGL